MSEAAENLPEGQLEMPPEIPAETGKGNLMAAAKEMLNFQRGKAFLKAVYLEVTQEYRINGKTAKEWKKELSIKLPADLTPQQINHTMSVIQEKYEEISGHLNHARMILGHLELEYKTAVYSTIRKLAKSYDSPGQKRPAADTIEDMAKADPKVLELAGAVMHAKIFVEFWDEYKWQYKDTINMLNISALSNSTAAKVELSSGCHIQEEKHDRD
jgi:hypothetical protein